MDTTPKGRFFLRRFLNRFFAAWISLALSLPSPAFALRNLQPTQSGVEEEMADQLLDRSTKPVPFPQVQGSTDAAEMEEKPPWPAGTGRERGAEEFPEAVRPALRAATTFAERAQVLVQFLGWSGNELGQRTGRLYGLISSWKRQRTQTPTPPVVRDVSRALLADPVFMLSGLTVEEATLQANGPVQRALLFMHAGGLSRFEVARELGFSTANISYMVGQGATTRRRLFEIANMVGVEPALIETGYHPRRALLIPQGRVGANTALIGQDYLKNAAGVLQRQLVDAWRARGYPVEQWIPQIAQDSRTGHVYAGLAARLLAAYPGSLQIAVHYGLLSERSAAALANCTLDYLREFRDVSDDELRDAVVLPVDEVDILAEDLARAHAEIKQFFIQLPQMALSDSSTNGILS